MYIASEILNKYQPLIIDPLFKRSLWNKQYPNIRIIIQVDLNDVISNNVRTAKTPTVGNNPHVSPYDTNKKGNGEFLDIIL